MGPTFHPGSVGYARPRRAAWGCLHDHPERPLQYCDRHRWEPTGGNGGSGSNGANGDAGNPNGGNAGAGGAGGAAQAGTTTTGGPTSSGVTSAIVELPQCDVAHEQIGCLQCHPGGPQALRSDRCDELHPVRQRILRDFHCVGPRNLNDRKARPLCGGGIALSLDHCAGRFSVSWPGDTLNNAREYGSTP
jgi:hypothetical protein